MKTEDQFARSSAKLNVQRVYQTRNVNDFMEEMFEFIAKCRGMNPRVEGFIAGLRVAGLIIDKEES
jgi:hypothetical protein